MANEDRILALTKINLNINEEDDAFDQEIITHINSVLFELNQLGVGPEQGFLVETGDETWATFMGEHKIAAVKSLMYIRVRLLFDPPTQSYVLENLEKQAQKLEWRLNVYMEGVRHPWVPLPLTPTS